MSPLGADLDPTFDQFELVGEIEERHELWGEPGKLKITGFLSRGRMGDFRMLLLSPPAPAAPPTSTPCACIPAGPA